MIWLMRAARWVRNPPSAAQVRLVVALVLVALAIVTIEWLGWWPDWATMDRGPGRVLPR